MEHFLELVAQLPELQELFTSVQGERSCSLVRVAQELRQHILHLLYEKTGRDILYVLPSEYHARRAYDNYIYPEHILLPNAQAEMRPVEAQSSEARHGRVQALDRLRSKGGVVFLSPAALLFKMRPPTTFYGQYLTIKEGDITSPQALLRSLTAAGYEYAPLIEGVGQVSGRGEMTEVYAPGFAHPLRITFFDDEIESIRTFDVDSQRSFGAGLQTVEIPPAHEFSMEQDESEQLQNYLCGITTTKLESLRESYLFSLRETGSFSNIEAYMDVLQDKCSILDYAKKPILIFDGCSAIMGEQTTREQSMQAMFAEILADDAAFGCEVLHLWQAQEFLEKYTGCMLDLEGLQPHTLFAKAHKLDFHTRSTVGFAGNADLLAEAIRMRIQGGYRVYLCAGGRQTSISGALQERDILVPLGAKLKAPGVSMLPLSISEGFEAESVKAVFFSEEDILGKRTRKSSSAKRRTKEIGLLADLHAGDIVVHEIHGKGKYMGLKTMEVAGVSADYMEIEYRDGDRLFIPTAQIGRIDKYIGPDEEETRLSKLGGREWENTKTKARASVKQLAENLVDIYRERSQAAGYQFSEDTVWQRQFEDNFGYIETPGQLECIEQVKQDMESTKIMDRLVMGDVGYGKTEVAMRACFKAVMDSEQVALLVPTTLLARQHYKNFVERFSGFPIRIEQLSRYTKKPKTVLENLISGKTDIVIGTHKLLGKNVKFKNLGLLVIDEEQRFGVSHKERIKDMKREIDVLTLTATPIPRTLEMALTGIRDMSTIDTPPEIRKEVQAYVAPFDWGLVRDAILKELNRGGQVFFVCRRISEMESLAAGIQKAVPEARIISAHGRMTEAESEAVMNAFVEREYDVLLCTTIIESGIDIPTVNTIIVYEADKFGLAQLYQLRGRIGRSNLRGYAYFTHLSGDNINPIAAKRLEAIREFTQLGSGMKIAMRDLQIRGAGNILGAEQSGHMSNVGYNLYIKMVREEVLQTMGKPVVPEIETTVEMGEDAFIPDAYIEDEGLKLDMYRKVAEADTLKKAKAVQEEFIDRFGPIPRPAANLLGASVIRGYGTRAGLLSIVRVRDTVQMKFAEHIRPDVNMLLAAIKSERGRAELRKAEHPYIVYGLKKGGSYTEMLQFMDKIRHCITKGNQV